MNTSNSKILHGILYIIVIAVLIWSGIHPKDYPTWILEVAPTIIALVLVTATYNKFRLTNLLYVLIAIHCIILCVGGKYTYAETPFGFWLKEVLGTERNPYDRLGHLAQGFIPAILAREILIRFNAAKNKKWLFLFVTSICLGFSAFYELLEFAVAEISGEDAVQFLATQGDVWDTQWDMLLALIGALFAQISLAKWHDKLLEKVTSHI